MEKLTTDSLVSRRIVRAFLDFLDYVEPASGVDTEGLQVARDCLLEVFRINQFPGDDRPEPNALVNLFCSLNGRAGYSQSSSAIDNSADAEPSKGSKLQESDGIREDYTPGVAKDELFGQFFAALEQSHFFRTTPSGDDDHALLDRATHLFHDAICEMEKSGCSTFDKCSLAETLKTLGNRAMQFNSYSDAIERYTCAIALRGNNAVYYCNRAAAYTQIHKYNEAVNDCLKSIELYPNYSKAYSRLGLAYYAQGNYMDAIHKGFRKALELDPNNDAVKENIKAAEKKMREQEQTENRQDPRSQFDGRPGPQTAAPPTFGSHPVPFDPSTFPANIASMFMNMAGNPHNGQNSQNRPAGENHGGPAIFTSMPFDSGAASPDFARMFMNMAGGATQAHDSGSRPTGDNHGSGSSPSFTEANYDGVDLASLIRNMTGNQQQVFSSQAQEGGSGNSGFDDPGISIGGNISVSLGEEMPEELTNTWRSVMGMFSGMPQGDAPDNSNERPASS